MQGSTQPVESTRARSLSERLKIAFLGAGGLALFVAGPWVALDHLRFLDGSERTRGVVVRLETRRVRGSTLYEPVVRYRPDGANADVEFTAKPALWPSPFDVGDRVTVAHRSDDPEAAKIESFWMLWFLPIVMGLMGIACMFAGWHTYRNPARSP